jgi:hypothetical protein
MSKRPHLTVSRTRRVRGQPYPARAVCGGRHTACAAYDAGYTLIEILVSTTLALILLGTVITIFGNVSTSVSESRSMLESAEQLRLASTRLQQDLAGVTVTMNPPRKPENNEGYFEIIEGPVGIIEGPVGVSTMTNTSVTPNLTLPLNPAVNGDANNVPDSSVGDFDDILMFTTRSTGRPFVGKGAGGQSDVAEVAWFVRGRTLYRRVLLVVPSQGPWTLAQAAGFYAGNDISVSVQNRGGTNVLVANTLGDLTRRECRYAHQCALADAFPYDARRWQWRCASLPTGFTLPTPPVFLTTLPTLRECSSSSSSSSWVAGCSGPPAAASSPQISALDFWSNNISYRLSDQAFAASNLRISDDVILNNVIGFDVKVWDPVLGMYVDLGNAGVGRFSASSSHVVGMGKDASGNPTGAITMSNVYDTWSTHYESTGAPGLQGTPGQSSDGLDNGGTVGVVDDDGEKLTSPPYPYPLRGIQVKIRVFEPDSRQVREVTVVQDFLPQ